MWEWLTFGLRNFCSPPPAKTFRTALLDFDAVIELEPEKGRHYYNRGVVYHRMGRGLSNLSDLPRPYALGRSSGREEDAIEDLSRAIELGSTEAAVFSERGLAWRSFGNMAQAQPGFEVGRFIGIPSPIWHLGETVLVLEQNKIAKQTSIDIYRFYS